MRKLLLTLSTVTLAFAPAAAHATFDTPSNLLLGVQSAARTTALTVHSGTQGTYLSVWADGASKGSDPSTMKLKSDVTIDVAQNGTSSRAKGQVTVSNGSTYFMLSSLDEAKLQKMLGNLMSVPLEQWVQIPMDTKAGLAMDIPLDLSTLNAATANDMFTLEAQTTGNVHTYTLHLTEAAAANVAQKIRAKLNDTSSVSDDFFPWDALAKLVHFEFVIKTDADEHFLSSKLMMSMQTKVSYFTVDAAETASTDEITITEPTNSVNIETLFNSSGSMLLNGMMPTDNSMMMPSTMNFDSVEPSDMNMPAGIDPACTASTLTDLKLLSLERAGICPVERIYNR